MRFYWSLKSVPELRFLPPAQRERLWRNGLAIARRHRWASMVEWFLALAMIVGYCLYQYTSERWPEPRTAWILFTTALGIAGLGIYVHGLVIGELAVRNVREALCLCRSCGYDLRASKERCPECGTPIAANVEGISK